MQETAAKPASFFSLDRPIFGPFVIAIDHLNKAAEELFRSAFHVKAAVRLKSVKRSANDPKRTFNVFP